MHEEVKIALIMSFNDCFPDFERARESMPEDEANADYVRNLIPMTDGGSSCVVNDFGFDAKWEILVEEVVYEDVLYNWFSQEHQINVCVEDEMFIAYMIENGDKYCDKVKNWVVGMLED
jgi:hypothetical protein